MRRTLVRSARGLLHYSSLFFFFFQAEDGIRDGRVTGVQTCALPISMHFDGSFAPEGERAVEVHGPWWRCRVGVRIDLLGGSRRPLSDEISECLTFDGRSEERRVGKECRSRW